ncbi:MAG: Double zinc ribbon [Myxococcaceae bacterium]|nr:Double zinc ribbon [Myxococcaceae bacterium]
MALTKFVRNVDDLSDDGGYKFRFKCDRCSDGVESEYVSSSANLLKTGLEIFQMFRPFGFGSMGQNAVSGIDRGLRGKEHDAAYERAVNEAAVQFHKCSHCGLHVCSHCWNDAVGLCEGCAPDAHEHAAIEAASNAVSKQVAAVRTSQATTHAQITCPVCSDEAGGGKFCQSCGASVVASRTCSQCQKPLGPTAKFCGECGAHA